nr:unnamed protein product [Callosobruchus analis]
MDTDDDSSSSSDQSDSTDSSLDEKLIFQKRRTLHRNLNFVEKVIASDDDIEFKEDFRMDRRTCNYIIGMLFVYIDILVPIDTISNTYMVSDEVKRNKVLPVHKDGRKKISARKAVLMTIWYLSNTDTFREISKIFNVTKSSAHRVIRKIVQFLSQKSKSYMKWPNSQRLNIVREGFRKMINGVVRAIDGCHINIKKPREDAPSYCNRMAKYSILIQGVCDHNKKFIDLLVGEAGSIHDARLLKRSSLYEKCVKGFLQRDFLLGDSAYPCLNWSIPPFRDNGNLTPNQREFNYRHSATRIKIENAFGALKGKFRLLKRFDNENIMFMVECIVAAAVIHNICIDLQDSELETSTDGDESADLDEVILRNISGIVPNDTRRNEIFTEMFGDS